MSNPARRPFLGEDVHYVSFGTPHGEFASQCRAAKITGVGTPCDITVFNPSGIFLHTAPHDENNHTPGSWHFQHT